MTDEESRARESHSRRFAWLCVAATLCVGILPLVALPLSRGAAWNGALPYVEMDELTYASYDNALASGRPRRNDPFTGRDEETATTRAESFSSVQFIPAYALASIARSLGWQMATVFALLTVSVCVAAALIVFQIINAVVSDARFAFAGTLATLFLATVPTRYGIFNYLLGRSPVIYTYLPFLRRHVPAFAFPLFFGFCLLTWRALHSERRRASLGYATLAGATFAALVFTYFFFWTAAAAWLACLALLWLLLRPSGWRGDARTFAVIAAIACAALAPYFRLLSQRAASIDSSHALAHTHAPDLLRLPELLAFVVLVSLAYAARRGLIHAKERAYVFTLSFALMPLAVFNQQIATGLSLQPVHYEMYVANFCALLSAVLTLGLIARAHATHIADARLFRHTLVASGALIFVWGLAGSALSVRSMARNFRLQDESLPVATRLAALARETSDGAIDTRSIVFAPDLAVADLLPAVAPQPMLWAPRMFVYAGDSIADERARYMTYLYYTGARFDGVDERNYTALDARRRSLLYSLISPVRANPTLTLKWQPISPSEIRDALRTYADFVAGFDRERAASHAVSYLVVSAHDTSDLSNFDHFYERDAGERIGDFILYRVRLRP